MPGPPKRRVSKKRQLVPRQSTSPEPLPFAHEALRTAPREKVTELLDYLDFYLPESKKYQRDPRLVGVITGLMARTDLGAEPDMHKIRAIDLLDSLAVNKSLPPATIVKL